MLGIRLRVIVRLARGRPEPARLALVPRSGGRYAARIVLSDGRLVGPSAGVWVIAATAEQSEALGRSGFPIAGYAA